MLTGRCVGCWSWWQELGTDVTVSGELIDYLILTFTGDGYGSLKENNFNCFVQFILTSYSVKTAFCSAWQG